MKKKFVIVCFLFFVFKTFSQQNNNQFENLQNFDKQKVHFGYFIGVNLYNSKIDYKKNPIFNTQYQEEFGLNIGLIGDLRLSKNLNLRFEPGLQTSKASVKFNERSNFTQKSDTLRSIKSTYIHLPLLLKFSSKRINNFRPYVIGGISTSLNLSSNENSPEDNKNKVFRLKSTTFYYELGFGIDFYLYYFKFTPSIRGVFGMNDELVRDKNPNSGWTSNIEKMYSRGVFINFTIQ